MTNATCRSQNKVHMPDQQYASHFVPLQRASISKKIKADLSKLSAVIKDDELQTGLLHLFFGQSVADRYRHGDAHYVEAYFTQIPAVIEEWAYAQFPDLNEIDILDRIRSVLIWAVKTSRVRMLVSLHDALDFETLQQLQLSRHSEHQLKMLDAIIQGHTDAVIKRDCDLSTFTPSITQQTRINFHGVRFCSYETFLHLSDNNGRENVSFAAANILKQLKSDYLHHGLTLSSKELALFLTLHFSTLSSELMMTEDATEEFYRSALGRSVLQRYVSEDQLQHIVRHHTMLRSERNERKEWHDNIMKIDLPPRLLTRIKKMILLFHEMYVVTLNNRDEFFTALKPLYVQSGYCFDGFFGSFAKLLLDTGCNIKYVTQAYERFAYHPNYLRRYPFADQQQHYTLDLRFLHDFYVVLHPVIVNFFHLLKQNKNKKEVKKVSNIILKSMLSYNLETSSDLTQLAQRLNVLQAKLKKGILMQPEVLATINQKSAITSVIALCEDKELEIDNKVLHTIKHTLNVEELHLKMAANMMVKERYIDLCSELCNTTDFPLFHAKNHAKKVVKECAGFNVGVLAHNNPLALLGPALGSVCIDFSSVYHHQQLNPSFMNLCVYDDQKLILWGLLCRAYNETNNETVYILNNFQGSINNHRIKPKEVQKAVIDTLKEFIVINGIDSILMKDQFFNTINLCDDLPSIQTIRNRYFLERNARLDFVINTQGVIQQDLFYVLEADE